MTIELAIKHTVSVLEGGNGRSTKRKSVKRTDQSQLTASEITFLKELLELADKAIKDTKNEMTNLRELLWESCDKADADSYPAFKELNKVKNQLRKLRTARHKVANINLKLKQQYKSAGV